MYVLSIQQRISWSCLKNRSKHSCNWCSLDFGQVSPSVMSFYEINKFGFKTATALYVPCYFCYLPFTRLHITPEPTIYFEYNSYIHTARRIHTQYVPKPAQTTTQHLATHIHTHAHPNPPTTVPLYSRHQAFDACGVVLENIPVLYECKRDS